MGTDRFDDYTDPPPLVGAALTHTIVREDAQRVRVCFCGEIDLSTADVVETVVTGALRAHHPCHIDVDLTDVRFIDSIGIRALLSCRAQAIGADCQLTVTNAQPKIQRILEITGVLAALTDSSVTHKPDTHRPLDA